MHSAQRHQVRQHGQAMIEFAIVLILIIMVVAGGAELAITAYHASKTGDGAKAAANDWANAVSFTNGVLVSNALDTSAFSHLDFTSALAEDCSSPSVIPATSPIIIKSSTAPNECNLSDSTHLNTLITKLSDNSNNPAADFAIICKNSVTDDFESCTNTSIKFLVEKPITYHQQSGSVKYLLGDHSDPSVFRMPSCIANNGDSGDYDNGLPLDGKIYLFNPLPINITNCAQDTLRSNQNGTSILFSGYINKTSPALNIDGLPKLNLALRSQYHQVCVADVAGVITIQPLKGCVANGFQLWLKPPGKMCGAGTAAGTEYCPGMGDLNGATGFYFFGDSNISGNNLEYIPSSWANPELQFRPTFQLVCGGADYRDSNFDAADECRDLSNPIAPIPPTRVFAVQVNTRYRSIFESFLTFGLQAIPIDYINGTQASLLPYFYNPNQVGVTNQLVGTAGSEIGPIGGKDKTPTVKRFRDFRGCYQVDIIPPDNIGEQVKTTVSACN
ncbi:MAG: pilus assembly protein [Methylotenera sp.]|nr:pilus assembly protein [Methylotenera sp.]